MHTVLIADDDKFFRDTLAMTLQQFGYDIIAVSNGNDAVRHVQETAYEALILDAHLEGINGVQVLSLVKNLDPELPVIVITGDSSIELERKIRTFGVFYYLLKPFKMEELREVITSATRLRNNRSGMRSPHVRGVLNDEKSI